MLELSIIFGLQIQGRARLEERELVEDEVGRTKKRKAWFWSDDGTGLQPDFQLSDYQAQWAKPIKVITSFQDKLKRIIDVCNGRHHSAQLVRHHTPPANLGSSVLHETSW